MAQVDVTINGRGYKVACDDGQEAHLGKLGEYVDARVAELTEAVGQIGDSRLLVMASLLIADELADAQRKLQEADAVNTIENHATNESPPSAIDDEILAQGIEAIAERIEGIADRLEQA